MPVARPLLVTCILGAILAASIAAQEPAGRDEAAALEFVREHHRELADLLKLLRAMDRDAYDEAIADLTRARENIDRQRRRDPDRAGLLLESWKAESRVELITARLISKPDATLEAALRRALADQIAAQLALQKHDRVQLQARLEQLDEQIRRLERRGDALVETRLNAALKKIQRVRRQDAGAGQATPDDPPPGPSARPEGGNPR